jgi:hypothetical protein
MCAAHLLSDHFVKTGLRKVAAQHMQKLPYFLLQGELGRPVIDPVDCRRIEIEGTR